MSHAGTHAGKRLQVKHSATISGNTVSFMGVQVDIARSARKTEHGKSGNGG
jgi:hypothetical protein